MFNKILIANRGEIACRIMRTAKKLGIQTVAVYSEADKHALHVKQADEAYFIGPAPSRESYLKAETLVDVALTANAQAIHPGYGFLAENGEFAELCDQAGLIFIGPPPEAIYAMGSKSAAKTLMHKAGVPLIPGYHGDDQTLEIFVHEAEKIGYPILLKAASGGGGKGMRVVWKPSELADSFQSAKREAKASFNDDKLLLEKYLDKPRHIEIQVFADQFDNYVYLFERDCSIQRRHQKIIEEAPAINFSETLRHQMGQTAIKAAQAINYVGAGTIEFLFDGKQFYFMEMNTRLQVEHPVTEMITGLDLVEWQIRVAAGEKLTFTQEQLRIKGHAIEVRICAEDPNNQFLPATGDIHYLLQPKENNSIRIDTGISQDDTITPYYDPMIAKLIVHGDSRAQAIIRLQRALADYHIIGVKTNLQFLQKIIKQPDFIQGHIHTNFIAQHEQDLFEKPEAIPFEIYAIASLYLLLKQKQIAPHTAQIRHDPYSPWFSADNWHLNLAAQQQFQFLEQGHEKKVTAVHQGDFYQFENNEEVIKLSGSLHHNELKVIFPMEKSLNLFVYEQNDLLYLLGHGLEYCLANLIPSSRYEIEEESSGNLTAPMPGTVVALFTKLGQTVSRGERLIVIEAMKMEHTINAPADGIVKAIYYNIGDMVEEGAELISIEG